MNALRTRTNSDGIDWANVSQRLTAWVLGTGMLVFHVTVFFLLMTVFLLWNLWRSPEDIWAMDLLRRWGAVLIFHAIVVGAIAAAFKLLGFELPGAKPAQPAPISAAPVGTPQLPWPPAPPSSARGWPVARSNNSQVSMRSVSVARWTRDAVAVASARVNHALVSKPGDPTTTWPTTAVDGRTADEAEFIARFRGDEFGVSSTAGTEPSDGSSITLESSEPGDRNWTWVEAAAGSWTARRDDPLAQSRAERAAETVIVPLVTPVDESASGGIDLNAADSGITSSDSL